MRWIGSIILLLIIIFTSVTVVDNNDKLEALLEVTQKQAVVIKKLQVQLQHGTTKKKREDSRK